MSTPIPLELDPLFVRALRLLHSKAKDSADQLKQMLDDVLQQKSTNSQTMTTVGKHNASNAKKVDSNAKSQVSASRSAPTKYLTEVDFLSVKKSGKDPDEKKAEKRAFDKAVKQEPSDLNHDVKRARYDSPKASPTRAKVEVKKEEPEDVPDFGNTDADDFAMEMGLACIVCRNIEVSSGNRLVECQECHNLYHQECHKPPISDQDVNDPRLVWYCAKCTKNIKKLTSKNQKPGKSSPAGSSKEIIMTKPVKSEPQPPPLQPTTHLFKRSEVKTPPSISTPNTRSINPGNKPTGLAGLAASLTCRSGSSKTPPPSATSGNGGGGGSGGKLPLSGKSSLALPTLTKATAASSSSSSLTSSLKRDGVFSNLANSLKNSGNGGSSGSSSSSSKSSSNQPPKLTPMTTSSSSGNNGSGSSSSSSSSSTGNGNGGSKSGNGNSSASGSNSKNSSSIMSADKRLQIMKKKAEKKMQEKRWSAK